jgi:hypothetical protein
MFSLDNKAGHALDRLGTAWTVGRGKTKWKQMEAHVLHRLSSAQTFRHVSEQFQNSGQSKTF